MLALTLPAPILILTISPLGSDQLKITTPSGLQPTGPIYFVLQSTTNFVSWTSIATNGYSPQNITYFVQATNDLCFYRVYFTKKL